MRNVILYICMSLDGFIADTSGGVDWLGGEDDDNQVEGSYSQFIETVDTVIMGHTTYHQIITELYPDNWPYANLESYILTHMDCQNVNGIHFVNKDIGELIKNLKEQEGKHVWICGGADIVNQCIAINAIDRYCITVLPIIKGDGIRLFHRSIHEIRLKLLSTRSYNGMTDLFYEKR